MDTCALSGQAAGTAASVLFNKDETTSFLKENYSLVQDKLEDLLLVGKKPNISKKDITIETNSTISKVPGIEDGYLSSEDKDIFICMPSTVVDKLSLVIDANKDCSISIKVRCDILPHRFDIGYSDYKSIDLKKGRNFIKLNIFEIKEPSYLTFSIKASSLISFPTLSENLAGILMGHVGLPKYYNPYVVLNNFSYLSIDNLLNGYNRPYNSYNAWVSEECECELKVKASSFNFLKLFFDPNLERELVSSRQLRVNESHLIDNVFGVGPSLVKAFDIVAFKDKKEIETIHIRNNYKRVVNINFSETVDSIIIKFKQTWGEKRIRLFSLNIEKK
jgi:hypothetical protein